MEQLNNNTALAMLQAIASQNQLPRTGKSDGDSDFQKLMDKAASSTSKDTKAESASKTETAASKTEEAPVEKEDSLTKIKKMLEQNGNAVAFKPGWPWVCIDMNTGETTATYNPGEWAMVVTGEGSENVPITDLEPWQQAQLNQLLIDPHPIDVSDPRADALLQATAPGANNSLAALLEKFTAEQFGKEVSEVVEAVKPQEDDGDMEMELLDAEQAPQQIFHDVKAVPVKVGDVENTEQVDEPDVVQQLDTQIAQALQRGDSTVTVRLNPENLGEVTIQISAKSDGVLAVAITARNEDTRALLERHAANLQEVLANRVRESVEVNVQRQQESQQGQNQNYDGHNGHAQDGQQQRRQRQEPANSQDFIQQLRLGLIPVDGDEE